MAKEVNLGDEVKDTVTGFQGIASSRTIYLNGCERIGIQPPMDKEGKIPEAYHFDIDQIQVIKAGKVKGANSKLETKATARTGGPIAKAPSQR